MYSIGHGRVNVFIPLEKAMKYIDRVQFMHYRRKIHVNGFKMVKNGVLLHVHTYTVESHLSEHVGTDGVWNVWRSPIFHQITDLKLICENTTFLSRGSSTRTSSSHRESITQV